MSETGALCSMQKNEANTEIFKFLNFYKISDIAPENHTNHVESHIFRHCPISAWMTNEKIPVILSERATENKNSDVNKRQAGMKNYVPVFHQDGKMLLASKFNGSFYRLGERLISIKIAKYGKESVKMEKDSAEMGKKDALQQEKEGQIRKSNREIERKESEKEKKMQRSGKRYPDTKDEAPSALREPGAALDYYEDPYGLGKRQGEYTVRDYYALPEDVRVELIDGRFYDMASPSFTHEIIGGEIYVAFRDYIRRKGGKCIALKASMDTQVDRTDRTILQPDVFILCDPNKRRRNSIYGAPDLMVEILSPSTAIKDKTIKLKKYRESGVREYWIVDPEEKTVLVYCFFDMKFDVLPTKYTFKDKVPVGIFDGECEVDFAEIERYFMRFGLT